MNGATLLQSYFDIIINHPKTSLNELNKFYEFKNEWNQCKKATKEGGKFDILYCFLYESNTVYENRIKELFGESLGESLGKSLYEYVCAVSQPGNVMPCPVRYNYKPGRGAFKDRMDIKLKEHYVKYFSPDTDDNPFKKIFKEWEIFVEANFLQKYFKDDDYKTIKPLFVCSSEPNTPIESPDNASICDWNNYFKTATKRIIERTNELTKNGVKFTPHTFQPSV